MESEGVATERYRTGGMAYGVIGIGCVLFALVYGVVAAREDYAPWLWPLLVFLAVSFWSVLIRPALVLGADEVELRNALHSRWVPYRLVDGAEGVDVGQVTVVRAEGRRYVASGFGRSRRTMRKDDRRGPDVAEVDHSLGWLIESKLRRRVATAHAERSEATGGVRHAWAWPEVVLLAGSGLASLVLFLAA